MLQRFVNVSYTLAPWFLPGLAPFCDPEYNALWNLRSVEPFRTAYTCPAIGIAVRPGCANASLCSFRAPAMAYDS